MARPIEDDDDERIEDDEGLIDEDLDHLEVFDVDKSEDDDDDFEDDDSEAIFDDLNAQCPHLPPPTCSLHMQSLRTMLEYANAKALNQIH